MDEPLDLDRMTSTERRFVERGDEEESLTDTSTESEDEKPLVKNIQGHQPSILLSQLNTEAPIQSTVYHRREEEEEEQLFDDEKDDEKEGANLLEPQVSVLSAGETQKKGKGSSQKKFELDLSEYSHLSELSLKLPSVTKVNISREKKKASEEKEIPKKKKKKKKPKFDYQLPYELKEYRYLNGWRGDRKDQLTAKRIIYFDAKIKRINEVKTTEQTFGCSFHFHLTWIASKADQDSYKEVGLFTCDFV